VSKSIKVIFETYDNEFDSSFETDLIKDFMEFMKNRCLWWRESEMEPIKQLKSGLYKSKITFHFNEIDS